MFTKIGQILPGSMEKNGLAPRLAKARVLSIFEEKARALLPPEMAHAFKPLHLVNGTLTIACKTSPIAVILRNSEVELREALEFSGAEIERIRFLLAPWR